MRYQKIPRLNYRIYKDEVIHTGITIAEDINLKFLSMTTFGVLTLKEGYAWNGVTGGIDDKTNMVPSAEHDALFQLISLGLLPVALRHVANDRYINNCKKRKMGGFRRWTHKSILDKLSHLFCKPEKPRRIYEVF
tara:strand:- start:14486 stop:14890 length:405 start_codon:yes stop_codon:yes gene_type:complete